MKTADRAGVLVLVGSLLVGAEREQADEACLESFLNQGESLFSAGKYAESVER